MDLDKIKYGRDHVAFTYHICWTKENLHYYGLRTAEGCHPTDIWTTYFTSSDPVKELRKTIGEPDLIETRRTFKIVEKAIVWENTVLRRLKVTQKDDWINNCSFPLYDNRGKNNHTYGKSRTKETKKKISESLKGKRHSEETKKKMSESMKGKHCGKDNPFFNKKHSEEVKSRMSKSRKGKNNCWFGKKGKDHPVYGYKHSEETLKNMSECKKGEKNPNFEKTFSEETKKKMSESSKGKIHSKESKAKMSKIKKEYWKNKK